MRLSREARILFAIVAIAAAAWVWVNYYNQPEGAASLLDNTPSSATGSPPSLGDAPALAVSPGGSSAATSDPTPAATSDPMTDPMTDPTPDASAPPTVAADATTADSGAPVADLSADSAAPQVAESASPDAAISATGESASQESSASGQPAVAPAPSVATRDIEVVELPFLITAPPQPAPQSEPDAAAAVEAARPSADARLTVNPFSPILLAPPPEEAVAQPNPAEAVALVPTETNALETSALSVVTEVPIPAGPSASEASAAIAGTETTSATPRSEVLASAPGSPSVVVAAPAGTPAPAARVVAPAPQLLAPASPVASNLPRSLPSGTLSATPDLLRLSPGSAVASPQAEPANLAAVAAISVPGAASPTLSLSEAPSASPLVEAPQEDGLSPILSSGPGSASPSDPVAVGATDLSRYLRDQNYRFTGSVVGPVAVGVFRVGESLNPVVVPLGQTLPDTDIVLTSLQGKQAEFTQANDTQVLVLDLR